MSNPFDQFDEAEETEANPFDQFDNIETRPQKRKGKKSALRKVDAAVRGAADMLSFGFADELSGLAAGAGAALGGENPQAAYDAAVAEERAVDELDRREVPWSRGAGQVGGFAGGLGYGAIANLGRFTPNILRGANGILGGAQAVARNVGAGAGFGALAGAGAGEGDILARLPDVGSGALWGGVAGGVGVPVAAGAGAAFNILAELGAPVVRKGLNRLGRAVGETGLDPATMRQQAQRYRDAGLEPALVDVLDDSGRGVVRAAASRMTPARQGVTDFRDARAADLQGVVSEQARRHLSPDPRTPAQIAVDLGEERARRAGNEFGAVRGDVIDMAPETVQALRNPLGREAISEAARRERDPEVRAALNRLAQDALDDPSTPITVGMADRISRTLYGRADAAARAGDNDLATTFSQLAGAIRNPAREASEGYGRALEGYAEQSALIEAADRGEDFLSRNTDEFVAEAQAWSPEQRELARAAARRAVEQAAGTVGRAPGVARDLAIGREQAMRTRALLGDEAAAEAFEEGMGLAERQVRNANDVAPRIGSQTQTRGQDAEGTDGANMVRRAIFGGLNERLGVAVDFLAGRGMSREEAQAIAEIATDPARLDAAIGMIETRLGVPAGDAFRALWRQSMSRVAGENSVPPSRRGVSIEVPGLGLYVD